MAKTPETYQNRSPLAEKLKKKKDPSLGELNPLIFPPDLESPETLDVLRTVVQNSVAKLGLLQPAVMETAMAWNRVTEKLEPRIIIRFDPDRLSKDQLDLLEDVTHKTYGKSIVGRMTSGGQSIPASFYPNLEAPKGREITSKDTKKLGWYMGTNTYTPSGAHKGLFVYRDLGKSDMAAYLKKHSYRDWFFKEDLINPLSKDVPKRYLVEIHEASLYQTDIVEFALQISSILKRGEVIKDSRLKYEIYNDLNRLGLKKAKREDVQGLDEQLERIERTLINPLANLDASTGIGLDASSSLLIGVPGTGKTLVAEYLLQQDTGVFILPIDSKQLATELSEPPEKRTILPRISEVFKQTQIPIILHIDDIEQIGQNDQAINSTILNLMAGVRESGFHIIASTNDPEKLTNQLLQPQRFSEIIYFGLQPEDVRLKILETHALKSSKELGKPLFSSDEDRNDILKAVAKITESFTPRYLGDICTQAKAFLLEREIKSKVKKTGLTEKDLSMTFTIVDWQKAIDAVSRKYDKANVVKRDQALREFAKLHARSMGLLQDRNGNGSTPQLEEIIFQMRGHRQKKTKLN
jgi:ATP-dependent 26S proteasome regulatory subunit